LTRIASTGKERNVEVGTNALQYSDEGVFLDPYFDPERLAFPFIKRKLFRGVFDDRRRSFPVSVFLEVPSSVGDREPIDIPRESPVVYHGPESLVFRLFVGNEVPRDELIVKLAER
jgi:hypothetical protein